MDSYSTENVLKCLNGTGSVPILFLIIVEGNNLLNHHNTTTHSLPSTKDGSLSRVDIGVCPIVMNHSLVVSYTR